MQTAVAKNLRYALGICLCCVLLPGAALAQLRLNNSASPLAPVSPVSSPPVLPEAGAPSGTPEVADVIAAVVNDDVITRNELFARAIQVKKALVRQGTTPPSDALLLRQVLEHMIEEKVQLQEAKDTGVGADDAQVDAAIGRLAEQNKLSLPDFEARAEAEGTTWPEFREQVRKQITLSRLRQREVDSTIQVSEGEIDNYLAAQKGKVATSEELDIDQILVRVPEQATADQIDSARRKADDLYGDLMSGGDFGKLAVSYSNAPDALTGGDMGWRTQEHYPQVFLEAVASLSPGQVTRPFKSPNGFHILKLAGRRHDDSAGAQVVAPVMQTHVRHILIRVNETMSADQARAKLLDIRQRIVSGKATFADMAKQYSADGSAANGGDLGIVYPGDTVAEFEKAMDALKPGEISEPVQTSFGMHLIQVLDRKTEALPKDRVRAIARQAVHERKADEAYQDWVRSLRDGAYVEIRLDDH